MGCPSAFMWRGERAKRTRLFRQWSLSAEAAPSRPGCTLLGSRPQTEPARHVPAVSGVCVTTIHRVPSRPARHPASYLSDNNERVALLLLGVGVVWRASS